MESLYCFSCHNVEEPFKKFLDTESDPDPKIYLTVPVSKLNLPAK